ncbi:MAG: hypothetical protein AAB296_02755, partial [Candidatus Desantisbacteria bacterium]
MNKIFIILIVLLSYVSLCFCEDIDREKIELSTQSEEESTHFASPHEPSVGSSTQSVEGTATVQPEASEQGTTSSITKDMPPQPSITTAGTISNTHGSSTDITERIIQGTASSTTDIGNPAASQQKGVGTSTTSTGSVISQQEGAGSSTIGSPTLSSQPVTGTGTGNTVDNTPQGIWGKIGSWMMILSGTPTITGSPSTTGLIFVPTAFRLDKQAKLNADFVFTYYIGEFWNKTKEKMDIFNPINRLSCSGDFKYSFILEKKWIPAAAFGYQGFIGLQGKASSAKEM